MATKLDKEVIRESSVLYGNREIIVTLTEDQRILFKLKGMKSGEVSIDIESLYKQLLGIETTTVVKDVKPKQPKLNDKYLVNLNDLRSNNLITKHDYKTKLVLEELICELIKENIKIFDAD